MRSMTQLINEILNMSKDDMDLLAEALAFYDIRKTEQFKFFLEVHIKEEEESRLKDVFLMKAAIRAQEAENKWKLGGGSV